MAYTLKLSSDSRSPNAAFDPRTAPVIGNLRTIAAARKMAQNYGDPNAEFRLLKGATLNRYLRADGRDL